MVLFKTSTKSASNNVGIVEVIVVVGGLFYRFHHVVRPGTVVPIQVGRHMIPRHAMFAICAFVAVCVVLAVLSANMLVVAKLGPNRTFDMAVSSVAGINLNVKTRNPDNDFTALPSFTG